MFTINAAKLRNIFLTLFRSGMCYFSEWILCLKKPVLRNVLISLHAATRDFLEKKTSNWYFILFFFFLIILRLMKHVLANVWEQLNMDVPRKKCLLIFEKFFEIYPWKSSFLVTFTKNQLLHMNLIRIF